MNTPITDDYKERWVTHFPCGMTIYEVARRLETDRAALMEALDRLQKNHERITGLIDWPSTKALSAARANFPES